MDTSSLFRQLGLTARGVGEGVAALPNMLWNGPVGALNQLAGTEIPLADVAPPWMRWACLDRKMPLSGLRRTWSAR